MALAWTTVIVLTADKIKNSGTWANQFTVCKLHDTVMNFFPCIIYGCTFSSLLTLPIRISYFDSQRWLLKCNSCTDSTVSPFYHNIQNTCIFFNVINTVTYSRGCTLAIICSRNYLKNVCCLVKGKAQMWYRRFPYFLFLLTNR